jgi:hypothetical protein
VTSDQQIFQVHTNRIQPGPKHKSNHSQNHCHSGQGMAFANHHWDSASCLKRIMDYYTSPKHQFPVLSEKTLCLLFVLVSLEK